MATLKLLIANLVMPLPLALLLVMLALLLWLLRWRRAAQATLLAAPLLILLMAWAPIAWLLLSPLEQRYPALVEQEVRPGVSAVVVLGSAYYPDPKQGIFSQLSETATVRLAEGVRLHRQQGGWLIVSGGSRRGEAPIAAGYLQGALALGVAERRIMQIDSPLDTAQEAYAVKELLGEGAKVLLVTSASHMPRAMAHFKQVGLQPIAAPTHHLSQAVELSHWQHWIPAASYLRMSERAWYEYMGMLAIRLDHP